MAKGISEFPEEKHDYLEDSDYLPDVPVALDSSSSEKEHSSELISKYQVKAKEPGVTLNLNETAPSEDCSRFRVEIRTDKEKIKEFQKTIKQLKKEKVQIEQWNARQQERIQSLKKKKKEERSLLKELREINFRLYWHNVVLTTKLKQKKCQSHCCDFILKVT
jgi:DNA repair exonuclease SbcCD ATPase subunit